MGEEDLYVVLGIEGGDGKVSPLEIRQAYRTRALVWHPDKQAGKKPADVAAAAIEFDKIQRANDILGDEKARKAYDELRELRKSRLEKERQLSSKRQKMMQDLRDRERAFETERAGQREEELATKRLQAEIARIRAANKRRTTGQGFDFSVLSQPSGDSRREKATKTQRAPTSAPAPAQAAEMQSTLKVTWTSTDGGSGGYTATRLKEIFEVFGGVEDVVIRESKSKKKGSALVVMSSKEAAITATNVPCGDFSNPLLVVPLLPSANARTEPEVSAQAAPLNVVGAGYRSFESDILTKMRQAAERARIIKEMQEEDAKG
ncbi:unnamed protein product [Calypogeia fissa]